MEQKSQTEEESLAKERIELEESRKTLERNLMEISGLKVLITSLVGRRENTLTEIKRLTLQQKNLQQQIENRAKDMVSNQNRIIEIDNDVSVLEGNVLKQTREKDTLSNRAVKEEENLRENEGSQKQMDQNIRELSRKLQEITEILSQIEIKRSEIKLQTAHIEERAYEDFNATREELSAAYDEKIVENEIEELDVCGYYFTIKTKDKLSIKESDLEELLSEDVLAPFRTSKESLGVKRRRPS